MPAAGYEIDFLRVRGIDRRNPLRAARAGFEALGAVGAARSALRRRRADVVMGGGGYVAGPAGLAATLTRTPLVLTEADSHLGLANRLLAGRARRVCLAFPIEGREGDPLPGDGTAGARGGAGGGPRRGAGAVRDRRRASGRCWWSAAARARGRSTSPRSRRSPSARAADFRVLHLAGARDYASCASGSTPLHISEGYELIEYEPNLGDVLAACDLVLGRSGGSIFEFTAAGRPAVLVPYPHATADHQRANARWMERGGRGDGRRRRRARPGGAAGRGRRRSSATPERLETMAAAARELAKPDAARDDRRRGP